MITVGVDFETYYDDVYSLRKMTPVEYILDPRFECMGAGIEYEGMSTWMKPELIYDLIARLKERQAGADGKPPEKVAMVSHNSLFDMCIMAWVFGFIPDLMIDTIGLSRAWLAWGTRSFALKSIASMLGLPEKGNTLIKAKGMRRQQIEAASWYQEYCEYGVGDVDLAMGIYRHIIRDGFPASEILVMDTVLRCGVMPKFILDQDVLLEHLQVTQLGKLNLLDRVGVDKSELMSNEKFANLLRAFGVEPPTKISLSTGKETYAFAKTDEDFIALEEDPNPDVQALVAARLGIKSTIEETRTQRFISISNLSWGGELAGLMPIPLKYSGAHTHRLSGEWKLNLQNLKRGGRLRDALVAPSGHRVISADASQIEARLVAWFCGQNDLVEVFRNKGDPYLTFAMQAFQRKLTKKENPDERYVGKTCILGMGFGIGWLKFLTTIRGKSKIELGKMIDMDEIEAQRLVNVYRSTYPNITAMWRWLGGVIPQMTREDCYVEYGPIVFLHEKILLPSGLYLYYHNLENIGGEWVFEYNGARKRIYGGKMLENIIQALARICTMDAAVRMRKKFTQIGYQLDLALQCHDELVYVEPEEWAYEICLSLLEEMRARPVWAPALPLNAEAGYGTTYGNAKDAPIK